MKNTLRKSVSVFVCLCLLASAFGVLAFAQSTGKLTLNSVESSQGTVKLALVADNLVGLTQGQLTVTYDKTVFSALAVDFGMDANVLASVTDPEDGLLALNFDNTTGVLTFDFPQGLKGSTDYSASGLSVNGEAFELAVFTFSAIPEISLEGSEISFAGSVVVQSETTAVSESYTCIDIDGGDVISVKENPEKALFLNSDVLCIAPGLKPRELLEMTSAGVTLADDSGKLKTGSRLELKAYGELKSTVTLLIMGDVDCDGKVAAADARLALRTSVGLEALNPIQQLAAMVTDDAIISAADARLILRGAVGLEKIRLRVVTSPSEDSQIAFDTVKSKAKAQGIKDENGVYTCDSSISSIGKISVKADYTYDETAESISVNVTIDSGKGFENGAPKISVVKNRNSHMANLKISYVLTEGAITLSVANDVLINAADLTRDMKAFSTEKLVYSENGFGRENSVIFSNTWLPVGIAFCDTVLLQSTGLTLSDLGFLLYTPSAVTE